MLKIIPLACAAVIGGAAMTGATALSTIEAQAQANSKTHPQGIDKRPKGARPSAPAAAPSGNVPTGKGTTAVRSRQNPQTSEPGGIDKRPKGARPTTTGAIAPSGEKPTYADGARQDMKPTDAPRGAQKTSPKGVPPVGTGR